MGKQMIAYLYNAIVLSSKKEWAVDTVNKDTP